MGHLQLAVLGLPEVRHEERLLTFRTRKALALLVYLAVEGGRHSREKLATLFWPESDPARGRMMLRSTLLFLRRALDAGDEPRAPPHLIVERDTLAFNFSADFDLDLHALDSAWARASASQAGGAHGAGAGVLAGMQTAVDRYRADFLDGFSLGDAPDFDDWAGMRREFYHRRMSLVLESLSERRFQAGELVPAIDSAGRWVAHDPFNELAHQRLIQCYFLSGDRLAARKAYDACRALLAQELNAEPSPEIQALAARLASDPPPARPSQGTAPIGPLPPVEAPLLGRGDEYAQLVAAYSRARSGRVQVVLLEGEAGIGKTRLALEFLRWAAAQGAENLQGRAFEAGGRVPYQPLLEAVRSWFARQTALDTLLPPVWLAELSRLLPELADGSPGLPQPPGGSESETRTRLFEAFARLGQSLAVRAPLVVFVDDVQWADAASLDVIHYAIRRWQAMDCPILLLLSLRAEELGVRRLLEEWISGIGRDSALLRVSLGPLSREDTVRLVQALGAERASLGDRPRLWEPGGEGAASQQRAAASELGQWLFTETRGHPLFITETIKSLLERGLLRLDLADGLSVMPATLTRDLQGFLPPGVQEVVRARLAHLGPKSRAVLAAAAVLGQRVDVEALRAVARLDEDEIVPVLDELLERHLLYEVDGEYLFTHDKIRQVTYTEAGEARRRLFHRRALDVLQGPEVPPSVLARHALAARLPDKVFHLNLLAGNEALRLFAVRDAIAHYEQALRAVEEGTTEGRQPVAPVSDLVSLYRQLGRAYELSNELDHASAIYRRLLESGRQSGEPDVECLALNRLATLTAHESGDVARARSLLSVAPRFQCGKSGERGPRAARRRAGSRRRPGGAGRAPGWMGRRRCRRWAAPAAAINRTWTRYRSQQALSPIEKRLWYTFRNRIDNRRCASRC